MAVKHSSDLTVRFRSTLGQGQSQGLLDQSQGLTLLDKFARDGSSWKFAFSALRLRRHSPRHLVK